ncbi:MAG: zinc-dependent peptidase [Planctomycetes bacterium]|nr:zinc-dependent peptidase [Planctomycetota bacterium]
MRLALLSLVALPSLIALAAPRAPQAHGHVEHELEGWKVRVDRRLLEGADAARGKRALDLLRARLIAIATVVPEVPLARLRAVTIQLDRDVPGLEVMQYHPSAEWLESHGYSRDLALCVHIPSVEGFLSPFENHRMPWVVLHELAHAYHHQVLGFDEPRIAAAWEAFRAKEATRSVLTNPSGTREHYARTDPKEFFAEMTESYFGSNDFYPFVAVELELSEPTTFALLTDLWGPLPSQAAK